jgi:hypothetical protein
MAGGSNGYRAALVRRQLRPGLISSLPGTAGLPPFISSSTSYPELDSAERRYEPNHAAKRGLVHLLGVGANS